MRTIVLEGDYSRGKEVIELLKMLGGKDSAGLNKTFNGFYYWISENNEIIASDMPPANSMVYLLEDFEKEYPYKVGDCVRYYPHKISVISSMFITYDGDIKYKLDGVEDQYFQAHQLEYVGKAEYIENNTINLKEPVKQLDETLIKEMKESLEGPFFNESDKMVSLNKVCEYLCEELFTSFDFFGNVETTSKDSINKKEFIEKLRKAMEE